MGLETLAQIEAAKAEYKATAHEYSHNERKDWIEAIMSAEARLEGMKA